MYAYETKRSFQPDIKGFDSEDDNSAVWDNIIKINEVST